ncbi:MAG: ROK family protein [Oscillospiraceae bacterium]|nr:ROK family protein [Oscillospiraceae bacterium]
MRIGIDLGGTNIAAGLVDVSCAIIAKDSVRTPAGADAIVSAMADLTRSLCQKAGVETIESAGVGSPGSIDASAGVVVFSNNLHFRNVPLADMLSERLGVLVKIGNDANAAALGEARAGAAKGRESMILVTLGTGVGGGIIIGGEIYDGFNGMAGEVGHTVIVKDGALCTCGRKGCWEAYTSATGLIRMTKEAMERAPDSLMHKITRDMGKVSGRTAFAAERRGDAAAGAVVSAYLSYTACGLANLINLFQPAVLCLGGGIANEGQTLIERLEPLLEPECFDVGERKTVLRLAELGNDAGIIGAALL